MISTEYEPRNGRAIPTVTDRNVSSEAICHGACHAWRVYFADTLHRGGNMTGNLDSRFCGPCRNFRRAPGAYALAYTRSVFPCSYGTLLLVVFFSLRQHAPLLFLFFRSSWERARRSAAAPIWQRRQCAVLGRRPNVINCKSGHCFPARERELNVTGGSPGVAWSAGFTQRLALRARNVRRAGGRVTQRRVASRWRRSAFSLSPRRHRRRRDGG